MEHSAGVSIRVINVLRIPPSELKNDQVSLYLQCSITKLGCTSDTIKRKMYVGCVEDGEMRLFGESDFHYCESFENTSIINY